MGNIPLFLGFQHVSTIHSSSSRQARRQLAAATEARRASAASNDELSTDAATEAKQWGKGWENHR